MLGKQAYGLLLLPRRRQSAEERGLGLLPSGKFLAESGVKDAALVREAYEPRDVGWGAGKCKIGIESLSAGPAPCRKGVYVWDNIDCCPDLAGPSASSEQPWRDARRMSCQK